MKIRRWMLQVLALGLVWGSMSTVRCLGQVDTTHLAFERQVNGLMLRIKNSFDDKEKVALSAQVESLMDSVLQQKEIFTYAFDSLKFIGSVVSEDAKVRIFTWNLPFEDGTHKYFGKILYRYKRNSIELITLDDRSSQVKKPEQERLTAERWFGALYYRIIEHKSGHLTYYTLLGFDLNDFLTNKKIVEVLWFDDQEQVHFGAPIFKNQNFRQQRVIFEYSARATMGLKYDENMQMIIFDHLAPFKPTLKGQPEFYGPDFSYDGLKLERGIWNAYFDLDVRRFDISGN